jgi:hypothetical protein
VFEKISIRGRALVAAADLAGAIDGLERSIEFRNEQIMEIQEAKLTFEALTDRYLGRRTAAGIIDERFSTNVDAISAQTDDCIWFSCVLANDLLDYGNNLRKRYSWRFRLRVPKFEPLDWGIADAAGLIPPAQNYAHWLRGFKKRPSRWRRMLTWLRSWFQRRAA